MWCLRKREIPRIKKEFERGLSHGVFKDVRVLEIIDMHVFLLYSVLLCSTLLC